MIGARGRFLPFGRLERHPLPVHPTRCTHRAKTRPLGRCAPAGRPVREGRVQARQVTATSRRAGLGAAVGRARRREHWHEGPFGYVLGLWGHRAGRWRLGLLGIPGDVDVDLGHAELELRNGGHAAGLLAVDRAAELARPIERVKEADDRVATDGLFHTLQSRTPTQEFLQPETFAVSDDVVVGEDHQAHVEGDASLRVCRHENFLVKGVESLSSLPDEIHRDAINDPGQLLEVDSTQVPVRCWFHCVQRVP